MPLKAGYSRSAVESNIKQLTSEGYSWKQAVAIALERARKAWKKAHPGEPYPKHLKKSN